MPGAPLSPTKRGYILGLLDSGMKQEEIARRIGCHRNTISYTRRRLNQHGTRYTLPRPGRPSKINSRMERRVLLALKKYRWIDFKTLSRTLSSQGSLISFYMVRTIAYKHKIHRRIARSKPYLSPKHLQARSQYAKNHLRQDWSHVIFTDECTLTIGEQSKKRVSRKAGEAYDALNTQPSFRSGREGVMVWAGISLDGKTRLYSFDRGEKKRTASGNFKIPSVTAAMYASQIIKGPLKDLSNLVKQKRGTCKVVEDNARVHTAQVAKQARLEEGILSLPHPACSPDLNPIENLWGALKYQLGSLSRLPTTKNELFEEAQKIWEEITQEEVDHVILSMTDRIKEVHRTLGKPLKY